MRIPKVLIACEESQRVCTAMREIGIEAYSCDILPCSGGHPEWHIQGDVLPIINGNCEFETADGQRHRIDGKWDLLIAHPPCTYLTVSGNAWFDINKYGDKARQRYKDRYQAIVFFMQMALADCDRAAVENPICIMSKAWRKPDQIIQPYFFGHETRKSTCLWLKNLPKLIPTNIVEPIIHKYGFGDGFDMVKDDNGKIISWNDPRTAKERSKTFPGIAKAMAEQWGRLLLEDMEDVLSALRDYQADFVKPEVTQLWKGVKRYEHGR